MQHAPSSWSKVGRLGVTAAGFACVGLYADTGLDRISQTKQHLNPTSFTPHTLIDHQRLSGTSSILTLRKPSLSGQANVAGAGQELWKKGVWSVEIKQPQLMIARRYTPLPSDVTADNDSDLVLLVRREPQGEVSRYLHAMPVGTPVEVRGGYLEYELPQNTTEVLFLAGGTGIAPALQIARTLKERGQAANMRVLWANRHRIECKGGRNATDDIISRRVWTSWWSSDSGPPASVDNGPSNAVVQQLDSLSMRAAEAPVEPSLTFEARYFVDEEGTAIRLADIKHALTQGDPSPTADSTGRKLVIISGPDGFVDYLAGPKTLVNGIETQGPLGGLLSLANLQDWTVWKL